MRNARARMENMTKQELQEISLQKTKKGIATREAQIAQELLWKIAEHIYTIDFYDWERYFPVSVWDEYYLLYK